jgi:hypothetical protein
MSPDFGAQPVTQASGRTLIDYLKEYLARPDVVERMKPWQTAYDGLLKAFSRLCELTWGGDPTRCRISAFGRLRAIPGGT